MERSANSIVVIDQSPERLAFRLCPEGGSVPPLALAETRRWQPPRRSAACVLRGNTAANLSSALSAAGDELDWSRSKIILGVDTDPFAGGLTHLADTLKSIELMASKRPARLTVQTRSSFLLFALPVLRSLPEFDCVVSLETLDEALHARLLSHLPRPTERLELARTLRATGLGVTLRVSPIIFQRDAAPTIDQFADTLVGMNCRASFSSLENLLPFQSEKALAPLIRARKLLAPNAARLLRNAMLVREGTTEALREAC